MGPQRALLPPVGEGEPFWSSLRSKASLVGRSDREGSGLFPLRLSLDGRPRKVAGVSGTAARGRRALAAPQGRIRCR